MNIDWNKTYAAIWRQRKAYLRPVQKIDSVALVDLVGIDQQKQRLIENTLRFINDKPANNALLWGARGTGKSSLIKALLNEYKEDGLRIIEVDKTDIMYLPEIVDDIRELPQWFVLFCDDLSFETTETSYKALKSVLEGSIELPPNNVLLYATSNRRHLVPEFMSDNLDTVNIGSELHYSDNVEEKISLSDRFGLCLSFYSISQKEFLTIVDSYFPNYERSRDELHDAALKFSRERGARSGRTAKQFYNSYAEK